MFVMYGFQPCARNAPTPSDLFFLFLDSITPNKPIRTFFFLGGGGVVGHAYTIGQNNKYR